MESNINDCAHNSGPKHVCTSLKNQGWKNYKRSWSLHGVWVWFFLYLFYLNWNVTLCETLSFVHWHGQPAFVGVCQPTLAVCDTLTHTHCWLCNKPDLCYAHSSFQERLQHLSTVRALRYISANNCHHIDFFSPMPLPDFMETQRLFQMKIPDSSDSNVMLINAHLFLYIYIYFTLKQLQSQFNGKIHRSSGVPVFALQCEKYCCARNTFSGWKLSRTFFSFLFNLLVHTDSWHFFVADSQRAHEIHRLFLKAAEISFFWTEGWIYDTDKQAE